jgi:1,2-diacylglycerol 3-beta-glucosyltransferase
MDYPRFEVIVIDDASSDRTGEIARTFPVTVVSRDDPDRRGKSEALNAGLALARGDVVCVFDADSEMGADFLRRAVVPLVEDPAVCGVQGQVRMYNRGANALTRSQDDEFAIHTEVLQLGRERLGGACALGGNGQLTRRSSLEAIGGWNPTSLTEDLDLTVRLYLAGCGRIAHCTRAVVWQEGVPTLRALLRQRTRWAEGILRCYGEYAVPVLTSRHMPARLRIDTFWALFTVFLPILTLAGLFFTALSAWPGFFVHALPDAVGLAVPIAMLVAACVWSVTVSWRRDGRMTLMPVVRHFVYILHWVPAFACALGNVARAQPVVWQKTEHGTSRSPRAIPHSVPAARKARAAAAVGGATVSVPVATRG